MIFLIMIVFLIYAYMFNHSHDHQNFNLYIEGLGSFSPKSLNMAEWMIFFYMGCCLSGLGIVKKKQAHTDVVSLTKF